MKKLAIAALALVVSTAAHAQFESGKQYIGASMTGLNLSYNGSQDLNLGIQAKAGYFVEDDWMLLGQVEYNHSGLEGVKDYFSVGAQARYYIEQNGLYLGGGVKLAHSGGYNDFMPGVEVGYAFFREFVYLRLKKQHIKRVTRTDVEEYAEEEIASSFIVPNEK
jgi:hypothetical protein